MKQLLIALVGPTGSGKSDVGVLLAKALGGEVISCDSMQVYRGMPICTQSPTKTVRGIRHHLAGFLDPTQEYSAARFRRDAEKAILQIVRRKKVAILVGGTGLYFRSLLDGLFDSEGGAAQDEAFRQRLRAEAAEKGAPSLHNRLALLDPAAAKKIHPNDLRRIIRALEVHHLTGKPISALQPTRSGIRAAYDCRVFLLDWPRPLLYQRIEKRVDRMMRAGLLKEARRLSKKKLSRTASMALGLREMQSHWKEGVPLKEAVEELKKNTRHYAKRQLSWFRHERDIEIVPIAEKDTPLKIAKEIVRRLGASNSPHRPPLYKRGGMLGGPKEATLFVKEGGTGGVQK